jgi:hypothetical protein
MHRFKRAASRAAGSSSDVIVEKETEIKEKSKKKTFSQQRVTN